MIINVIEGSEMNYLLINQMVLGTIPQALIINMPLLIRIISEMINAILPLKSHVVTSNEKFTTLRTYNIFLLYGVLLAHFGSFQPQFSSKTSIYFSCSYIVNFI